MKKLLLLLLMIPLFTVGQFKVPDKSPSTYVFDYDAILRADQVAHLNKKIIEFKAQSSIEIAVVVLSDLQGQEIEDVAQSIFREWGIGDKNLNNGVLYIVSPKNRKGRIHVGYGLEGDLTDYDSKELQKVAREFYKAEEYYTGIERVLTGVIEHLKPISWQQRELKRKSILAEREKLQTQAGAYVMEILGWLGAVSAFIFAIWWGIKVRRQNRLEKEERDNMRILTTDAIKTYQIIKKNLKTDEIEKDFDKVFSEMKTLILPREQPRKRYTEILAAINQNVKYNFTPSSDKKRLEQIRQVSKTLKLKAAELATLLSSLQSQIKERQKANEWVKVTLPTLPILKRKAEKALSSTPYGKDKLDEAKYDTLIRYKGQPFVIYASLMALIDTYTNIINYKQNEAKRKRLAEQAKKDQERKKKLERNLYKQKETKKTDNSVASTIAAATIASSYSSNSSSSSSSDDSSSSSSSFDFGGGSSGGGGSSDSW